MALPIYESGNIKLTDAPSLQYVDIQQQEKTNQRIGQFLQFASEVTGSLATDYAQEQAIKYTIANPITKDRIDASIASGTDPLQGILTGGMDYNAALKKATAQQTAGVLENELHAHFSDVIARVDRNELTNREEILNELQSPIQGQIKFFSQIDPEIASAYGNQATNIATNKYQTALALLNKKAEEKSLIESEQYGINASKDFDEFLRNNPGASAAAIKEYINASETVAMQNSYKFSTKPNELLEFHKKRLKIVKDNYLSEQIAKEFQGKDILEVVDSLRNNKSMYSKHYKEMDPVEQIDFENLLKTDLNLYKADNAAQNQQLARDLRIAEAYVNEMADIPTEIVDRINSNIDVDSVQYINWQALLDTNENLQTFKKMPLNELQQMQIDLNNRINRGEAESGELFKATQLRQMVSNLTKKLADDQTLTVLSMAGIYEDLDFSDYAKLKTQMNARSYNMNKYGKLYNINKPKLLSKQDVNNYTQALLSSSTEDRSLLIEAVAEAAGENAYQVFNEVAKDSPAIGHFAQLILRDIDQTTSSLFENGLTASQQFTPNVPNATDLFAEEFGTAYDLHPGMMTNIIESANVIYLGLLQKERKPLAAYDKSAETAQFDKGLYTKALELASGAKEIDGVMYGGVVDYNGQKISLPSSIARDEFDSKMRAATPDNIITAMAIKVDAETYIPLFSKINGKYYLNTYDPNTGRERVTDQVVAQPLLEMKQGDFTQREFDIDRIRDANLEMDSDKHAFINIDGAYFVPDFDPTYKIMIDVESVYNQAQTIRGVGGFDPAILEKQRLRASFEQQERFRINQLPKELRADELRKLKVRLEKEF